MEVRHHGTFIADHEPGVAITCHQVVPARRMVVAGLANGSVAVWRRKPDAPSGPGRVETKPQMLHGHSGLVYGVHVADEPGIGGVGGYLLFSWSADRTVRVWDPESASPDQACAQTLRAHGGTITGLVMAGGFLVTSSTDKTLRVWRPEEGRELMLYPWFNLDKTIHYSDCWINALALNPAAEGGALYVGDEQGTLSAYRVTMPHGSGLHLTKWRRQPNAHVLGITHLVVFPARHSLATSSYDCTVKVWDTLHGGALLFIENGHKVRYTAVCWDETHAELLLGDELGHIYFWDVPSERCLRMERLAGPGAIPREGSAKVTAALASAAKAKAAEPARGGTGGGAGEAAGGRAAPNGNTGRGGAVPSGSTGRGLRHMSAAGGMAYTCSGAALEGWTVLRGVRCVAVEMPLIPPPP